MNVQETLASLRKNGFARIDSLLSPEQVEVLRLQSDALLRQPTQSWDHYAEFASAQKWRPLLLAEPGKNTTYLDALGLSPAIDEVLCGLFENQDMQRLLLAVLGRSRLWYFQIRRAEPHGRSLRIHQDIPGEVGVNILLSNVTTPHGTTVFWPRSHRWPRLFDSIRFVRPGHVRRFLTPAQGRPGDMYLFYNCIWHGMAAANAEPSTSIIVTFLPAGTRADCRRLPDEVLAKLGKGLRDVMEPRSAEALMTSIETDDKSVDPEFGIGPDHVVSRGVAVPIFSLWRVAIAAAWTISKIASAGDAVLKRVRH